MNGVCLTMHKIKEELEPFLQFTQRHVGVFVVVVFSTLLAKEETKEQCRWLRGHHTSTELVEFA